MPFVIAFFATTTLGISVVWVWMSPGYASFIAVFVAIVGFLKALQNIKRKPPVEPEPVITGLASLFPTFYHPLHIGQLRETKALGPKELEKLQKFPLVWKESLASERRSFDRFKEKDIFKKVMASNGVTIILGEPGAGKSTLMLDWHKRSKSQKGCWEKFVFFLRGEQKKFFIPLRSVKEESLGSFFKKHFNLDVSSLAVNKNSPPVFLFDGWDELPRPSRSTWKEAIEKLPGIKVVTCRTAYYQNDFKPAKPYYLLGLLKEEQRTFLKELAVGWSGNGSNKLSGKDFSKVDDAWADSLADRIQSHSQLTLIAGSPLFLTLIAFTNTPGEDTKLPRNRAGFYKKALESLYNNKIGDNPDSVLLPYLQDFLETLAGNVGGETDITSKDLKNAYVKWKGVNPTAQPEEKLREAARVCGILRSDSAKIKYQFLHLTFQEWLLAEALYKEQRLLEPVKKYWRNADYNEVLALAWSSATAEEREKATEYLIKAGCQDAVVPAGEPHKYRSGLRSALHLWSRSGEKLESGNSAAFKMLMTAVSESNIRKRVVATDDSTPEKVLRMLAKDEDNDVRRYVAVNSSAPEDVLRALAKDEESGLRLCVAENSSAPGDVLRKLTKDKDARVRRYVANNSSAPEEVLRALAKDNNWVRSCVARSTSLPEDMLRTLVKDGDEYVRSGVAENSSTPEDVLRKLAEDEEMEVRKGVAENSSTPEDLLRTLAKDEDKWVRMGVARNSSTPEDVLRALAKDEESGLRWSLAENSSTPEDVLRALAKDKESGLRWSLAGNSATPEDILRALAKDEDSKVRRGVAGNNATPENVLRTMAEDNDEWVRWSLAGNSATPENVLRALAKDEDSKVRSGVAENPNACLEWF